VGEGVGLRAVELGTPDVDSFVHTVPCLYEGTGNLALPRWKSFQGARL
jgi:hypothetical protein